MKKKEPNFTWNATIEEIAKLRKSVVMRGLSPIERMIDMADMRCTVCNAKAGTCDCWTKCDVEGCRWSYEKGGKCGNPNHA